MNLLDMINRPATPLPWAEGEKIPWHEPGFSERMLAEHLSQSHDAASRRSEKIDAHVAWVHEELLGGRPARVLDLCCGPGLYTSRLTRLGHECVGIDYSPASIAYAKADAEKEGLACRYLHEDIRQADCGSGFALVMLVFGEFNVFSRDDAGVILTRAHAALTPGGRILLEPHTLAAVEKIGRAAPSRYSAPAGLFSDRPHLCLEESFWQAASQTATTRYFIIDAATGEVTRHAATCQGYTDDEYRSLLAECGFEDVRLWPTLTGSEEGSHPGLLAITARKPGAS